MSNKRIIPRKKLIGSSKCLPNAPVHYKGRRIGTIQTVNVIGKQIVVEVKLTNCYKCGTQLKNCQDAHTAIGPFCPNQKCDVSDGVGLFNLKEIY